jgi:hypothetical protein
MLDDEELRSVGRVATAFAALEVLINSMVWRLLGTDEQAARHVTSRLTLVAVLDLGRRLGSLRLTGQPLDDFQEWIQTVSHLCERRDALIHTPWASEAEGPGGLMNLDLFQGKFHKLPFDRRSFDQLADDVQVATVRGMVIAAGPRQSSPPTR